ncbi:MAG: DUF5615 family PIN-like protein [Nocardioides sp.]|uniref:DUF5615 family PIN-like protein n=1 Tax=Nocardioides sp. TaxID=35761 RepID=UPI0039E66F1A
MTVALLFDEHYPFWVVDQVSARGIDAVGLTRDRAHLVGADDTEVLRAATAEGRVVVTEDVRTFPVAIAEVPTHLGVVFVRATAYPRTRAGMTRLAEALVALLADPPEGLGGQPVEWWL